MACPASSNSAADRAHQGAQTGRDARGRLPKLRAKLQRAEGIEQLGRDRQLLVDRAGQRGLGLARSRRRRPIRSGVRPAGSARRPWCGGSRPAGLFGSAVPRPRGPQVDHLAAGHGRQVGLAVQQVDHQARRPRPPAGRRRTRPRAARRLHMPEARSAATRGRRPRTRRGPGRPGPAPSRPPGRRGNRAGGGAPLRAPLAIPLPARGERFDRQEIQQPRVVQIGELVHRLEADHLRQLFVGHRRKLELPQLNAAPADGHQGLAAARSHAARASAIDRPMSAAARSAVGRRRRQRNGEGPLDHRSAAMLRGDHDAGFRVVPFQGQELQPCCEPSTFATFIANTSARPA